MRLWTVHPRYLDAKGIVAAWREALLAQKVLAGRTRGYTQHPQLIRFKNSNKPSETIAAFLAGLADEADVRGYRFDKSKIPSPRFKGTLEETRGQLLYEWEHLKNKLQIRAPDLFQKLRGLKTPEPHPLFRIVSGGVRDWEIR